MRKYKKLEERVSQLEEKLKVAEAQLKALNAPTAIHNDCHDAWMFFDKQPLKKTPIGTVFYGDGYLLELEKK